MTTYSASNSAASKSLSCNCSDRTFTPICGEPINKKGIVIQFCNQCALAIYNCNNPTNSELVKCKLILILINR